jgi:hypothetical protein
MKILFKMKIITLNRMTSSDVAAMSVVIQTHTIKPVDPWSSQAKVRRVTRHKSFNSRTLVKTSVSLYIFIGLLLKYFRH